jgi:hypothetical protein
VRLVRHRQTKETEQIGFTYGIPRQSSTLHLRKAIDSSYVAPKVSLTQSQGWVLITLENFFFSLVDENIRPTTPLSTVNTL